MLNPFFQQGSKTEQGLIQDLINEQLRMYGVEVYYLPRKYVTTRSIIKEVIESKFENAYPIEAYVETYDGYNGLGTLMSKFGIQELDDLTITISRERFETYISPLIKDKTDIKLSTRPKEGDLIYFPLGDRLFEIKYVEHEKPFYQLQKNYTYQLTCELFRYEDELIDTSIENIDDNVQEQGYIQTLKLVGTASTATAVATIFNGGVRRVIITNRGRGYTSIPKVAFSSAPSGGITATGIATMISDIIDCNGVASNKVQGVLITNSGIGYTVTPNITFIGGGGSGTTATVEIANGIVGVVSVTNGGSGYALPPTVTVSSPGIGTTAIAVSNINSSGVVTSITMQDCGVGYTSTPSITISSPLYVSSGTFKVNEMIVGSTSGSNAIVNSWNAITNELKISKVSGKFTPGETIVGTASSASRKLISTQVYNTTDSYSENKDLQEQSSSIIDFSEKNPFGMP